MAEKKLTQKQENFCLKYIECGNASEAYRFAYSASKMKDTTVFSKASILLKEGKVRARCDTLRKEAEKGIIFGLQDVLKEIGYLAFSNATDFYDENMAIHNIKELPREVQVTLSEVTTQQRKISDEEFAEITKVKISDKQKALEMLMKHFGGYREDNSQKQNLIIVGKPSILE